MHGQSRNRGLTQAQRLARDQLVWDLRMEGLTYEAISRRMLGEHGVSISAMHASRCVERVQRQLHERFIDRAMQQRLEQVCILEHKAMRAFQEFERSCQDQITQRVTPGSVAASNAAVVERPETVTTIRRTQCGDARLLLAGMAALADIRKILGYDAPAPLAVDLHDERASEELARKLDQMAERLDLPNADTEA